MAVLPIVLLLSSPASAAVHQAERAARAETDSVPFGLLGPVGLVAVALGLLGMIAGTVRHRRRSKVASDAGTGADNDTASSGETTRPILAPADTQN